MKNALRILGAIAAILAVILGMASADVNASGVSTGANPLAAIAVGIGALALLKASEPAS